MPAKKEIPKNVTAMALQLRRGKIKKDDVPGKVRQTVTKLAADQTVNLEAFDRPPRLGAPQRHIGTNCGPVGRGGRVRYA